MPCFGTGSTLENAKRWLAGMETYSADQQLATLLVTCEIPRSTKILKTLNDKKAAIKDSLKKDAYLSHVMEIAILNHGKKPEPAVAPKRKRLSASALNGGDLSTDLCCLSPARGRRPRVFPPLSGSEWLVMAPLQD
jgi:hypothetical protein